MSSSGHAPNFDDVGSFAFGGTPKTLQLLPALIPHSTVRLLQQRLRLLRSPSTPASSGRCMESALLCFSLRNGHFFASSRSISISREEKLGRRLELAMSNKCVINCTLASIFIANEALLGNPPPAGRHLFIFRPITLYHT